MFLPVILERQHGVVPKYGKSALLVQYIFRPHFLHHLVTSYREDREANLCKQTDNKRIQHAIRWYGSTYWILFTNSPTRNELKPKILVTWSQGWTRLVVPIGVQDIRWLYACTATGHATQPGGTSPIRDIVRSRTRQNFELVHIIGPVQNFGPPARNFGPLRAEFAWREWRKTLGGHVANWAGLSGFSPRENKISHTFFIDCINNYSKVSNAHNSDDCHGVFNGGMLKQRLKLFTIALRLLGLDAFFPWVILICAKSLGCQTKENVIKKQLTKFGKVWKQRNLSRPRKP